MTDPVSFGSLDGFAPDARQVLVAADLEAEALAHDRIGTEHILLGLLRDEDTPVAQALRDAGASLAAARHKVDEAVGASGTAPLPGPRPLTKRAVRAVEGAVRISHQRRADAVTSRDLLLGTLNVEGTAGQVLRGLGVDIDRLRGVVEHAAPDPVPPASGPVDGPLLRCPSCGDEVGDHLRHRVLAAPGDAGVTRDALVFSCGRCGAILGVGPAGLGR